jgi:hypothetical protein
MLPLSASIVLAVALATASSQTGGIRISHLEGTVTVADDALATTGGRAELQLPDGALVHVDAGTTIGWSHLGVLTLHSGRVLIRSAAHAAVLVQTPTATLRLWPSGIYTILVETGTRRLLVSVAGGEAAIETRYGATTRVTAQQMAMMEGATGVPWAAGYVPVTLDGFALWSDARTWAAGAMAGRASATGLQSGAAIVVGPAPCVWHPAGWPCGYASWAHPLPPGQSPYAPTYAPNFTPSFGVPPTPQPPTERPARLPPPSVAPPAPARPPQHLVLPGTAAGTVVPRPPGEQ